MEAAFEWGIPVVTDTWLLCCLSEGQRVDFEKYRLTANGDIWLADNGGNKGNGGDVAQVNEKISRGVLSQCIICVSSKLKEHQAKLHSIAVSMDAKVVDSLSSKPSPTHLLHLSKTSRDTSTDYKLATKLSGCYIVSPQWLTSCKKADRRLNESDFPAFSIPESNKSTADSRLSASPPPENAADFDDSGPFIVEENEEPESAPNTSAAPKDSKMDTPKSKQPDRADPSPFVSEKSSKRSLRGLESATSRQNQPALTSLPIDTENEQLVPLPSFKQPPTRNQSELAPSIMENLSELLKMQQQASASKSTSTTTKGKRLRGRLQGRALSNNSLPPQNAATAMSRASSTHSSLSIDDASTSLERRASASTGSNNHSNSLEEYSAFEDMDPNGVLGSQAIHYVDPEAQMEKRKMLEKLGVTSGSETDAMLKGRTLSVMTMAAEGLNTRRRTTRSGAK